MKYLLSFLLLFLALPCYAHGFDTAQTADTGKHLIEFGITNQTPAAGQRVGMSFSDDDKMTGNPVSASEATVRISKGDEILFISSGFALRNDTILAMSFTFTEPGQYDVDFTAGDDRATFPITVSGTTGGNRSSYAWIGLAAVLGIAVGVLISRPAARSGSRKRR